MPTTITPEEIQKAIARIAEINKILNGDPTDEKHRFSIQQTMDALSEQKDEFNSELELVKLEKLDKENAVIEAELAIDELKKEIEVVTERVKSLASSSATVFKAWIDLKKEKERLETEKAALEAALDEANGQ